MAFIRPNDYQTTNTGTGINGDNTPSLSSGNSSDPTTNTSASGGDGNAQKGNPDFTNLSNYLNNNEMGGENVGNKVSSYVNDQANAATTQFAKNNNDFNKQVSAGFDQHPAGIGGGGSGGDFTMVGGSQSDNVSPDGVYTGPNAYAGSAQDTSSQAALQKANDTGNLTKDVAGRTQLIRDVFNAPTAATQTTTGGLNLDQFLMQNNPDSYDKVSKSLNSITPLAGQYAAQSAANEQTIASTKQAQAALNQSRADERAAAAATNAAYNAQSKTGGSATATVAPTGSTTSGPAPAPGGPYPWLTNQATSAPATVGPVAGSTATTSIIPGPVADPLTVGPAPLISRPATAAPTPLVSPPPLMQTNGGSGNGGNGLPSGVRNPADPTGFTSSQAFNMGNFIGGPVIGGAFAALNSMLNGQAATAQSDGAAAAAAAGVANQSAASNTSDTSGGFGGGDGGDE
jgi:hypothetical protein